MAAGRERDSCGLDPLGPLFGHALLVDRLARHAGGKAAELCGALEERSHDALADRDVVLGEVALRLARLREENLVRIRELDGALADLELDERARHGGTLRDDAVPRHELRPKGVSSV